MPEATVRSRKEDLMRESFIWGFGVVVSRVEQAVRCESQVRTMGRQWEKLCPSICITI